MGIREAVFAAELIDGWMSREELEWLAYQASTRQTILEIGSWKGRSTKAMAIATPGFVVAVDTWKGSENDSSRQEAEALGPAGVELVFKQNLARLIKAGKVVPLTGDSQSAVGQVKSVLEARMAPLDMLFIDGNHAYDAVLKDIETYVPLVRPGGLVCGHDYGSGCMGVVLAVHKLLGEPATVNGTIWACQKEYPV